MLNYLDNWLICAQMEERCRNHVVVLLAHVQSLGLHINEKKRRLQPAQTTQFLGIQTEERQEALRLCLSLFQLGATWNYLEALPMPFESYGGIIASRALGAPAHAPGTEVPTVPGTMLTEAPACQGADHQKALRGHQMVEEPWQHLKGQHVGPSSASPCGFCRCIPDGMGCSPQR